MNRKITLLIGIILFSLVYSVSAQTYCSIYAVQKEWKQGVTVEPISFTCTNQDPNKTVTLTSVGGAFSLNPTTPFTLQPVTPNTFVINFDSNAPVGEKSGSLIFDDGSSPILITLKVLEGLPQGCIIDIFPTSLSNIRVEQGQKKTRGVQFSVPSCYDSQANLNGAILQTDERPINLGELGLGQIQPGNSIIIPIEINAEGVNTGLYTDTLQFLVYDINGDKINVPSVSISVSVTQGISPIDESTFSTPPSCVLSATTLHLNNSYSFSCSGVVNNLDLEIKDSEYFIGKIVQVSSGIYSFEFMPTKYGEFIFEVSFKYKGAPMFPTFKQNLIVSSVGVTNPGTVLSLLFTPSLDKLTGNSPAIIQVIDNSSGNLITNAILMVDAVELNKSSGNFEFTFETNKDYSFRAKANGYNDLIQTISISTNNIEITINPTSGDVNTYFNITSPIEGSTLKINNLTYSNPYYGTLPAGINEIELSKDGYYTSYLNVTVSDYIRALKLGDVEFKKGVQQNFTLNKNASWVVYHQNKIESELKEYASGFGDTISFTPKKAGIYNIYSDGSPVQNSFYEIIGFSFNGKWLFMPVWLWMIAILIVIIIIVIIIIKIRSRVSSTPGFRSSTLSYE